MKTRRRNATRRTELLLRGALIFCLIYGVIALTDRPRERFPFFAWNLFTTVPKPQTGDYDVRILSAQGLNGKRVPIYFEDAKLQSAGQLVTGYVAVQRFGQLIREHKQAEADPIRQRFEATYLGSLSHVRYQVVLRLYDIRKRVECRTCFTRIEVIGSYTTD